MRIGVILSVALSLLSIVAPLSTASADGYQFFSVAQGGVPPLDGELVNPYVTTAIIEGDYVVFRTRHPTEALQPFSTIWSYNIKTKEYKRLVTRAMSVPGGTGNFTELTGGLGGPVLQDGFVVFGANDSGTNTIPSGAGSLTGIPAGIYSVPVGGGTIKRVVHFSMPVPDSPTHFFNFGQDSSLYGNFDTAGGKVVFEGGYGGGPIGGNGVYLSDVEGTTPVTIANREHPWNPLELEFNQVQNFLNPATNGFYNAFIGGTTFGYFGVFTSPIPPTLGSYLLVMGPSSVLPGETNGSGFESQILHPSVQLDGDIVGFRARDTSSSQKGIYLVNRAGGAITKVVSTTDSLPDVPDVSTNSDLSYGLSNGQVFFKALNTADNTQGYYIWSGGTITKVYSNLTPILGAAPYDLAELQPQSIHNGRIVFSVRSLGSPFFTIVLGIPDSEASDIVPPPTPPAPPPVISALDTVRQLAAQALLELKTAKKNPPTGKRLTAKQKALKAKISAARKALDAIVAQLNALLLTDGVTVAQTEPDFTTKKMNALKKAVRNGKSKKLGATDRAKNWKNAGKLLTNLAS